MRRHFLLNNHLVLSAMFLSAAAVLVCLLGVATSHPCDSAPTYTYVCDPARNGTYFFYCSGGAIVEYACPPTLVFNNLLQACDWPQTTVCLASGGTERPTTTTKPSLSTLLVNSRSSQNLLSTTKSQGPLSGHPCDAAPAGKFACDPSRDGYFFYCAAGGITYQYTCMSGLIFNNAKQVCDWPQNTVCQGLVAASTTQQPSVTASTARATTTLGATTTSRTKTTTSRTTTTSQSVPEGSCNEVNCQLPECRCSGTQIPGNLMKSTVPQMVLLTFDDGINPNNEYYYNQLFPASNSSARKNPNGCRTKATFFVSGDYVDMQIVKTVASRGNEIASHSRTHSSPSWWDSATWDNEIQGMRQDLAQGTGLPVSEIRGMRAPYLTLGGELQFSMLRDRGFYYDSSFIAGGLTDDGAHPVWPFTLKYPPTQAVCDAPICPEGSYPTVWEVPLIRQYTVDGSPCSMTDACTLPRSATKQDVIDFLWHNFNRHYNTNRSPFMISLHSTWFSNVPASFGALQDFLLALTNMPDVWQVSVTQALDWIRTPQPLSNLSQIQSWRC